MNPLDNFFKKIDRVFVWLSALVLGGMTLAIFFQVLARYVFKTPLAWSEELSRFLFIWMTFIAGYLGARKGQHIGVELVQNMFPAPIKKFMQILSNLIAVAFLAMVAYYCVTLWGKLSSQLSPALQIPMNIVYLGMIIGCVFMALAYLYQGYLVCVPQKEVKPQ